MLFKVDYTKRGDGRESTDSKWVNFVADKTEALKRFMDWFFSTAPAYRVRVDGITEVEFVGDLSGIDLIDGAIEGDR